MEKNKKLILSILGVLSIVLITTGITYAFFNYTGTGTTDNVIVTDSITFLYTEVDGIGNGIKLENAFPKSDDKGKVSTKTNEYFDFKITSKTASTIAIPYEVTARKSSDSDNIEKYIRVYLTKGETEEEVLLDNYDGLTQTSKVDKDKYTEKTIYTGEVPKNESNYEETFRLRMWLSDQARFDTMDMNNKTFKLTVNVYANAEVVTEQQVYKELTLNGADPVLTVNDTLASSSNVKRLSSSTESNSLVPVIISNTGKVTKADIKEKWYSYADREWANAVVLFGEDNYNPGDEIAESAIKQYYVWIPRYKYELWNVNSEALYPNGKDSENAINIVFESKDTTPSNGDENGEWLTHPAFTSFDTNGIWVGKYETSYNEETYTDNTKFLTTNPNYTAATTGINMIVKPNVRSLTNKNVSEFYTMSREVNETLNSHMMKNTEWGAVAYLTYSNYGKCTDGTCEEVYVNNVNTGYLNESVSFSEQWQYSGTVTGCSGNSASAGVNSNNNACETGYAWNEENNKASTTGNTSGIYDMSGGNWEYMMGVVSDKNGNLVSGRNSKYNSGFNGIFGCPTCDSDTSGLTELTTGIAYPTDTRYYDLYEYDYDLSTDIWYDYTNGKLGDATKEIAATKANSSSGDRGLWYSDYAHFPSLTIPWFVRGGGFNNGTGAGVLYFNRSYGNAYSDNSSRIVLAF